jgi:hypothetical protein
MVKNENKGSCLQIFFLKRYINVYKRGGRLRKKQSKNFKNEVWHLDYFNSILAVNVT